MKIAIDLDGVVFNVIEPWIDNYNFMFNDNLKIEDLIDGTIDKFTKKECSTNMLYGPKIITNEIMLTCKFYDGAKQKIKDLSFGHDLAFLTATFNHNRPARTKRLLYEFGDIEFDLIYTNKKWQYPFDLFIEDSHYFCKLYKECNPDSRVIMITRPWNEHNEWPDRLDELKFLELDKLVQ